jgi:hypothetical protein
MKKQPRRKQTRPRNTLDAALREWRAHLKVCYTCHAASGHPALYCGAGWALAATVTQARLAGRTANVATQVRQDTLW